MSNTQSNDSQSIKIETPAMDNEREEANTCLKFDKNNVWMRNERNLVIFGWDKYGNFFFLKK